MGRIATFTLYGAVVLTAVGAATIANLPAALVAPYAGPATHGQVVLANVSGTVLAGRGDATIRLPNAPQPLVVQNLEWNLRLLPLLLGEGVVGLRSSGPQFKGQATLVAGFGHRGARDVQVEFPAQLVTIHMPLAQAWNTPGSVNLKAAALTLHPEGVEGTAEAQWHGAHADGLGALGEYRATLKGSGKGPAKVELATLKGALRLNGRGDLTPAGVLKMGVDIDFQGPDRDRLLPLLGMLGTQRPDGTVSIQVDSQQNARPGPGGRPS